jgi:hypothetical protein
MKVAKTQLLIAIFAMLMGVLPLRLFATDWQSHIKKTWEFKAETGTVEIVLLAFPEYPNVTSLEIVYKEDTSPSIAEEVGFIREVVRQLPSLGYHVNTLSNISIRGFREPEVRERVAIAALHSKEWQSSTKVVGGAERVVETLLNSTGVYDAFNSAFEEYGLTVRAGGVEKVAVAPCMSLKLSDSACNIHHNVQVPIGANYDLVLVKKGKGASSDRPPNS